MEGADERDPYEAIDWLLERQGAIERKLATRHFRAGSLALYDLSSSYFEGTHCPLPRIRHSRDGKKNKLLVNYGLLTARSGCPVAIFVYEGNTANASTLMSEVKRLREQFRLKYVVMVGDRGMIPHKAIGELTEIEGLGWITALKSGQIRSLIEGGALQLGLFDERSVFELSHPGYPGERLIACRNLEVATLRAHKRRALLEATGKELERVQTSVVAARVSGKDKIGVRVGRIVNKDTVAAEAALDAIYVIRTAVPKRPMSAADAVRNCKALANLERAFHSLKTVDLNVRPIHHRLEGRMRTHIFLCMLAYDVEWHMLEAWRPLLFADEDQAAKADRDPLAPDQRSEQALQKVLTHTLPDSPPAHSFRTLLEDLSTIVRNTCRTPGHLERSGTFDLITTPTAKQRRTMELIGQIAAWAEPAQSNLTYAADYAREFRSATG